MWSVGKKTRGGGVELSQELTETKTFWTIRSMKAETMSVL